MRRALHIALTLLGVSLVVFVLIRVVPGDPVAMMIPPGAGPDDIARLRAFYGLDRSIPEQYGLWIVRALQGEFGTSISLRQDVLSLIAGRLPATLELGFTALAFAVAAGGLLFAAVAAALGGRPSPAAAVAVFLALGAVAGLTEAAERALVARLAPVRTGRGFGSYHALIGIAALPAGLAFGAVYQRLGGPRALWASAAGMVLAVGLWLIVTRPGTGESA